MTDTDSTIFELPKCAGQVVRLTRRDYQGYDLLDLRVFVENDKGEVVPTKKGLCIQAEQFPALVEHLQRALETLGIPVPDLDAEGEGA